MRTGALWNFLLRSVDVCVTFWRRVEPVCCHSSATYHLLHVFAHVHACRTAWLYESNGTLCVHLQRQHGAGVSRSQSASAPKFPCENCTSFHREVKGFHWNLLDLGCGIEWTWMLGTCESASSVFRARELVNTYSYSSASVVFSKHVWCVNCEGCEKQKNNVFCQHKQTREWNCCSSLQRSEDFVEVRVVTWLKFLSRGKVAKLLWRAYMCALCTLPSPALCEDIYSCSHACGQQLTSSGSYSSALKTITG